MRMFFSFSNKWIALIILVYAGPQQGVAQNCAPGVPSFTVDLTNSPDSLWISTSVARADSCCGGGAGNLKCIEFVVTLDSLAQGVVIDIYSGSLIGAHTWRTDCNIPISNSFGEYFFTIQDSTIQSVYIGTFSDPIFSPGELVTYYNSSETIQNATLIELLNCDTTVVNFTTLKDPFGNTNDSFNNNKIKIFPNPFKQTTTIEYTGNNIPEYILIRNITGKIIRKIITDSKTIILKREHLTSGLYFYELYNSNNRLSSGKLVVK